MSPAKRRMVNCRFMIGALILSAGSASADTVFEGFENGFGPWRADADMQRVWSVTRSTAQAEAGAWSLDFTANGLNDDGTVWVTRQLLLPAGSWNIGLQFAIWKGSEGIVSVIPAIGFIGLREPAVEFDFTLSPEGEVFPIPQPAGFSFHQMNRSITVSVPTIAYVAFGYDIVVEGIITRFFDSATLTGVPNQCGDGTCLPGEDACNCPADCGSTTAEVCDDIADNDCDGFPDCHDTDCGAAATCQPGCNGNGFCEELETEASCSVDCGISVFPCDMNGTCDGLEDSCFCPSDCGPPPAVESICDDFADDDCDGFVDCNDSDCTGDPACPGGGCDSDGVCESGEDCSSCPNDCISGSGVICGNGVCEAGDGEDCVSCAADCDGKQNGNPNNRFCCGDGDGEGAIVCDSTTPECNGGGFSCTDVPASGSCCGDGTCEGGENESSCAIDCAVTCSVPADCNDAVGCTDDDCVGGACVNTPNNANCPDDGAFCNGSEFCDATADCASTGDPCSGGETCNETTDTCDQPPCQPKGGPCTTNADCCSVNCKPNGTCR